jgi:hypothetical protein
MDSTLTVFLQTGAGVFDPVPSLTLRSIATTFCPNSLAAADLDGDTDLVNSNLCGSTLTVFFQTAAGVFDPVPSLTLGNAATTNGPSAVAVADLDGNGSADLVSASNFSDTLAVFFQTGAGVFDPLPSQTMGSLTTTGYPGGVALADLDLDGDVDLVSANVGLEPIVSSSLTVFFQTGPGVFDTTPSLTLRDPGGMTDGAVDLAAADLDGDGDADIVSANGGIGTLTVFYGSHKP